MPIPSSLFPILTVAVVGAMVLLAVMLPTVHPASAQTDTTPCATGVAVPDAANNPGLVSDCEALLASRDTLAGSATLNWSADTPISDWEGVTMEGPPQRVTELSLPDRQLSGQIPSALGNLSSLESLSLGFNQLSGSIPAELGNLVNLIELYLDYNQLTGPIPLELGSLSKLQTLNLSVNQLTGPIPTELGRLANLAILDLLGNKLTGSIPSELGSLSRLTHTASVPQPTDWSHSSPVGQPDEY